MWQENGYQLEQAQTNSVKSVSSACVLVTVRPVLHQFDVVVRELMPHEILYRGHGLVEPILVAGLLYLQNQLPEPTEYPLINSAHLLGLPGLRLAGRSHHSHYVPSLRCEPPAANELLLFERVIDAEGARGRIVPHRVPAVLFKQRHRVDDIPGRRMHWRSVGGHDETVNHSLIPRLLTDEQHLAQNCVVCPCPDYLETLGPHGHGIKPLEQSLVSLPVRVEEGRDAGIHPGVEHLSRPDILPPAYLALVDLRGFRGRIHIAFVLLCKEDIAAVPALPKGYRCGEVPLP